MINSFAKHIKRVGGRIWQHVPMRFQEQFPASIINYWIHALSRKISSRREPLTGYPLTTRFVRYPPLLDTLSDLINDVPFGATIRLCVMACSTGAELYSILWALRSKRHDLNILATGIDISESAIKKAKAGRYAPQDPEVKGLSEEWLSELFDTCQTELQVKDSLTAGVEWIIGDVRDDRLRARVGSQDIVVANNFLVFMKEGEARSCLCKVIQFIKPGGLLLCRGVDPDVRDSVAQEFVLHPIQRRIEELHEINLRERRGWPWEYWGLEPLDKTRDNWVRRYATLFQVPLSSLENHETHV